MKTLNFFIVLLSIITAVAQEEYSDQEISPDSLALLEADFQRVMDSINQSFTYQYGTINLAGGKATLQVPEGFKYLDPEQSAYVLEDLWGNPPSETLGLLFPEAVSPLSDDFTFCVDMSYIEDGYIDDEDAQDLDYDELLDTMKDDILAENPDRVAQGYPSYELVGWASRPYYDQQTKKLHWAKELKFEDTEVNTLNYDIRVLGRRGYLNLNAIGDITMLNNFNANRDKILNSVEFTTGNTYSDFNPDIDEVAAYGIGALVAGKLLAKAGFFAVLLKFWRLLLLVLWHFLPDYVNAFLALKLRKRQLNKNEIID